METNFKFEENTLVRYIHNGQIYLIITRTNNCGDNFYKLEPHSLSQNTSVLAAEDELEAFTPTDWAEHADQEDAIRALQARLDELAAKQFNKEAYRWHKRLIDAWGYVRMYRRQLCDYYADLRANRLEVPSILPYWVTRDKGEMRRTLLQVKRLRENMQSLQK